MTLRVATVLSAREWEARLVAAARDSAAVKLVLRAYLPDEVSKRAAAIDVVVAGAETPWVTPARVATWRRQGLRVVGVHPRSDRPGAERFAAGGADLVLADDLDADQLVREIRLLDPAGERSPRTGRIVVVTGDRGAPGRTEVALGCAWLAAGMAPAVLVDADLRAPALAVRLGVPPRPDLADCVDQLLDGGPLNGTVRSVGRLGLVPGVIRQSPAGVRPDSVVDVVESLGGVRTVVVDAGPWPESEHMVQFADGVVLVVEATPVGLVRVARMVDEWDGAQPALVLNKTPSAGRQDRLAAVRRWAGLEPAAVVPFRRSIAAAAASGAAPHRLLLRRLHAMVEALV